MHLLLLLASLALADDGDLQKMLENIPDIKSSELPPEPAAPVVDTAMDLTTYSDLVRAAIWANWAPDRKLAAKKPTLAVKLLVKVNTDGSLEPPIAVTLSGNKKFDTAAVDAVYDTPPVLAPPAWLSSTVSGGVAVEFTGAAAAKK